MARGVLGKRYAEAVFEIALSANQLDRWRRDLEGVVQGLRARGLMDVLESHKVRLHDKIKLVDLATGDVLPTVHNLVHLLIARERLDIFDQLVAEYGRLVDAYRGVVHAEVTTAVPLEDRDTKVLAQRLKKMLGKEVVVASAVDPAIVGGLVVRIDDRLLDGSTRSQLVALKRSLTERAG